MEAGRGDARGVPWMSSSNVECSGLLQLGGGTLGRVGVEPSLKSSDWHPRMPVQLGPWDKEGL